MNLFAFSGLLTFVTSLAFSVFSWTKGKKPLNKIWAGFCLAVSIWGLGAWRFTSTLDQNQVFLWLRIGHIGVILMPAFFLHFIFEFLEIKKKLPIIVGYFLGLFFLIINVTDQLGITHLLITNLRFVFNQFYVDSPPGPGYAPFLVFYFGVVIYSHSLVFLHYKRSSSLKQKQMQYFLGATVLGFGGGVTAFLMVFGVNFYPAPHITVPLYPLIMSYAILNYQLMDIEVIIKKTLVFAGLFAFVYGVVTATTILGKELFRNILGWPEWASMIPSITVIIFSLRPLENFLVKATDKYLFQKKYDYKHLIRQFMDELKSMSLNAQDIARSTVDLFDLSIRPASSAIFMINSFTNKYDLIASKNLLPGTEKIAEEEILLNQLKDHGDAIHDKSSLSKFSIELLIPLLIRRDLIGLLCLGKKKSDEEYIQEDIDVLSDLSGTLSIALNNAQLFEQRADAEKRAMIGTLAAGINHEIGNPLNIISLKLQAFRLLQKQGLFEKKSKDEILAEVSIITDSCLEGARRIADITKKIAEFAKPDKKITFDEVDVESALEETLSVLEHEIHLDHIQFEKTIRCPSPVVLVDRGQLKQILFNLIRNAAQAVQKHSGKIIVDVDKNLNGHVIIKVVDNGHGIPAKNLEKLFTPFYTTKEPGKGTGLGLALVKLMVERNNGKIDVSSQEGKGTTFAVTFEGTHHG